MEGVHLYSVQLGRMVEELCLGVGLILRDHQRTFIIMDPINSATYWGNIFKKK